MHNNKKTKKLIILLSFAALVAIGIYFAFSRIANKGNGDEWIEGVNYRPPTEDEKKAGEQIKNQAIEEINNNQQNNDTPPGQTANKKTVMVIITDAGQYDDIIEVRSFIPNHFEDGTCTITFRKGELRLTKVASAYKDATTTICTNPEIKQSEFAEAGTWLTMVTYSSKGATGTSEQKEIIIR